MFLFILFMKSVTSCLVCCLLVVQFVFVHVLCSVQIGNVIDFQRWDYGKQCLKLTFYIIQDNFYLHVQTIYFFIIQINSLKKDKPVVYWCVNTRTPFSSNLHIQQQLQFRIFFIIQNRFLKETLCILIRYHRCMTRVS